MKKGIKNKKGLTLIETLVAITIFSMTTLGFMVLFATTWESQSFTWEMGQASLIASRGVTGVVDNIRKSRQADNGAYLFESGDDFEMTFFADVDADDDTERLHYFLDSGSDTFKLGITNPTSDVPPTYPSGDETVKNVSTFVVNSSSENIFTYYDNDGNILATPVNTGPVRTVKVQLLVNIDPLNAPETLTVESVASIRNLSE